MPIELPNLDDRSFDDLVAEGRNMIPRLAPSWTDHNLSDPGITLMELFAGVTEQLIYRTNRVTAAHKDVFLKLIAPPGKDQVRAPGPDIDTALASAIRQMRVETRAITAADYERLACAGNTGAASARCLPRSRPVYHATSVVAVEPAPWHVTLIVAVKRSQAEAATANQLASLLAARFSQNVTALTTSPLGADELKLGAEPTLHIVVAQALRLTLKLELACLEEYRLDAEKTVGAAVSARLKHYFDIEKGGAQGQGWPLGQAIYRSTLYALITQVTGVDYIATLELQAVSEPGRISDAGIFPACYEYVDIDVVCVFFHQQET
jgi:hypothetical protein